MSNLPKSGVDLVADGLSGFLSGMGKALQASQDFYQGTQTGAKEASGAYAKLETAAEKSFGQIEALTTKLGLQQREYELLQGDLAKTAARYGETADETKRAQLALDKFGAAVDGTERSLTAEQRALVQTQEAMASIDGTAARLGRAFGAISDVARDVFGGMSDIVRRALSGLGDITLSAFGGVTDGIKRALGGVGDIVRGAFDGVKGVFDEVIIGSLRRIGEIAVDGVRDATRATVDFVRTGVSAAGNVEENLNVMRVAGEATAAQMGEVSKKAVALGADLELPGTSAVDASEAMLELTKAGLSVDQSMGAAKGTLQLAAAAETDAATAAQVMAGALNAFKLPASDAVRVTDLLAGAANASQANMADLSQGFNQAGFMFSATGQKVEDLAVSLAILTKNGLTGSDAGTALKNAMNRLINPTGDAGKIMYELGFNAYNAQGIMKPWPQIINELRDATADLTPEQRNLKLSAILLGDGFKAMEPLISMSREQLAAMYGEVTRSGQASELAAARMQGWNGVVQGFQSQMETLGLIIGNNLLPAITPLGQAFNEALGAIASGDYTTGFQKFQEAVTSAITYVTTAFHDLATGTSPLSPFLDAAVAALQPLGTMLIEQGKVWLGQFAGWASVEIPRYLAPLGPVVVGAVGQWFNDLSAWGQTEIPKYLEPWGPIIIAQANKWLDQLVGWIGTNGPVILQKLQGWADQFVAWIEPAIPPMLEKLRPLVDKIGAAIDEHMPAIQAKMMEWGGKLGWAIWDGVKGAIVGLGVSLVTWILDQEPAINAALNSWAAAFGNWVWDAGTGLVSGLARLAILTFEWLWAMPGKLVHEGVKLGEALIQGFGDAIARGVGWIGDQARNVAQAAIDTAKRVLGTGSPSRVFEQLGAWTAEGMQIGLEQGTPAVQGAMAQMASPVAYPTAGASSSTVDNSRQLTYAPVYGAAVAPSPQRDEAVARSMALW